MDIVLLNTDISAIAINDLCILRCVSREYKSIVDNHMQYMSDRYARANRVREGKVLSEGHKRKLEKRCQVCGCINRHVKYNAFAKQMRCKLCFGELMTKTQCKKDYKLDDADLNNLDRVVRYNHVYKKFITLFRGSDVIGVAMIKHRVKSYRELLSFLTRPVVSKVYVKRRTQLDEALQKSAGVVAQDVLGLRHIKEFLGNGSHGIRIVRKVIEVFADLRSEWAELEEDLRAIDDFRNYIDSALAYGHTHIKDVLQEKRRLIEARVIEEQAKCERKLRLVEALQAVGLTLRNDSEMCKRYIDGDQAIDIDCIVATMSKMNYLYTCTNYAELIREALEEAYSRAKRMIHDSHGYISNHEEYQKLLKNLVDRKALSEDCQKRAIPTSQQQ